MKKSNVYKIELKILILFIPAIVLTVATGLGIYTVKRIIEEILMSYNKTILLIPIVKIILYGIKQFSIVEYFVIFVIWFHITFKKKVVYFLEINNTVKDISEGNLEARIYSDLKNEFGILGSLARNINEIINKFNSSIIEERRTEQTKIDLITSISHDLRTPLTSILGYLQLIDNDEYENEFTLRSYVNIALTKTKGLKVLIDDLFELTTLGNYGIKIPKNKINIVELVKQLTVEHRLNFKKANIECRLNLMDEKIYVLGDTNKLVRAFENLIFNCIKYSKSTKFMDIAVSKIGSKVILEFVNYGEQILPMDIPYIFQRFYRVDKARSQETAGSGLGLAITKNIIELHGGEISVASNLEKTVFKIMLPNC